MWNGLAMLFSCGSPTTESDPVTACASAPGWSEADGVLRSWCTGCHASALPISLRQGAPLGVDFDTYAGASHWASRIAVRASQLGDMPPAAGMPDADRQLLADWVACGATGTSASIPSECGAATDVGPLALDAAGAVAWCEAGFGAVDGDLVWTGEGAIDCLCDVAGSLTVESGTLEAPRLTRVGGAVTLTGGFNAANLAEVASLAVGPGGLVETLQLSSLATVEGDLLVRSGPERLDLPRLTEVGGDFVVEGVDGLVAIDGLDGLIHVGGSLRWEGLPAVDVLPGLRALTFVGGDVVWMELGAPYWPTLGSLQAMDGSLVLSGGEATMLTVGPLLGWVGGDVVIEHLPSLADVDALGALTAVGGGVQIASLPSLETVAMFAVLATAGSLVVEDVDPITGIVLPLTDLSGGLTLHGNDGLLDLDGLSQLGHVGGDVVVTDNTALPEAEIEVWLAGVAVDGVVVRAGNGL